MIEISYIVIQLLIFFFLFSLNYQSVNGKLLKDFKLNYFESFSFSIVLQLNIILFLSFLNIELEKIITTYLIINLIIFLLNIYYLRSSFFDNKFLNVEFSFLFLIFLIIFFDISHDLTLTWDAEKFWFNKALNFYHGNTIESLSDIYRSHYPFFGDLIWAFFWKFSLISNEYAGRLFFAFFYVFAVSTLINNLNLPKLFKFIFIFLIILTTYDYKILFSGNKEVLIFSFFCLLMSCLYQISNLKFKNENYHIFFLISISNLLLWTKQEGFIYLISILIPLIFFFKIKINKKVFIVLSIFFFYFLKIFIYKFYNFSLDLKSCCYYDFSAKGILGKISFDRIYLIMEYFIFALANNFLFVIGFILVFFSFFNRRLKKKLNYLYVILFLNFSFIGGIFLMTDADLEYMLKTGIDRLVFMFLPVMILFIIEYINFFKKRLIN